MKVLLTVASLRPSYGGPANSVSQMAMALTDEGADVAAWAPDGSALETDLIDSGSAVRRLAGDPAAALVKFAPDVLHDNGIWLPHNHALAAHARRQGLPRVISLRGMLDPWALRHKRWKKSVAWILYQKGDLRSADHLHATAAMEAEHIGRRRLDVPVTTIPNGIRLPKIVGPKTRSKERVALFLGRIYPVKGLPSLVEAWGRVRPAGWRLRIAGPDEAGHRAEVEAAIRAAGIEDAVSFLGPIAGAAKAQAFSDAELFVLPSKSESFGMVVGEALAHGAPVLTTTAVPWPELEGRACGWRVAPTADGLAEGLTKATAVPGPELVEMGRRGQALIAENYSWPSAAKAFLRLYEGLAHR